MIVPNWYLLILNLVFTITGMNLLPYRLLFNIPNKWSLAMIAILVLSKSVCHFFVLKILKKWQMLFLYFIFKRYFTSF